MDQASPVLKTAADVPPAVRKIPYLRWYICGLLFFATTVNYVDRQVLGLLKPVIQGELGWREADYGWVVFAFQAAYALMMPLAGRIIDWLGTRAGYALSVAAWSLASMSHALAGSSVQFAMSRFALGIGEAGNFPAAIKTVAIWFPLKERALATGIFNSGSNIGAILAPLMVPLIAASLGWRSAFLVTGGLDLVWLAAWLSFYRPPEKHSRLSDRERALIESDRDDDSTGAKIRYSQLLQTRGAWAFLLGKMLTDPVWWFYIYWLPGFFSKKYGLHLDKLGPPLIVIYLAADIGSIGGGWLPAWLMRRGWTANRARKSTMLLCAVAVCGILLLGVAGQHIWFTVALIGLAAAAHQGWSANIFTLTSDLFPSRAVGSVVGLGGMGGAIGGMLVAPAVGYWLDFSHEAYIPLFFCAASLYLIALLIIQLLVPTLKQTEWH